MPMNDKGAVDRAERELDDLLADARDNPPAMPEGLAARIQADADAMQPTAAPRRQSEGGGVWQQLFRAIGGWPAMAGLASATVAGIWIGLSPPAILAEEVAALGGGGGMAEDLYLVDATSVFDTLPADG